MATAKKTPTKAKAAAPAKKAVKAPTKAITKPVEPPQKFRMPTEVKEWIEQAMSRLRNMQSKIDRLESDNIELKSYKRWAEQRILGSSRE